MRGFIAKYLIYLLLVITILLCAIGISIVYADEKSNIPPPKQNYNDETLCVEPVEIMRKQHFEFVLEHRDDAVIDGIRTKKHSLIECIECHITANAQGEYARYSQDTHFCASCHQFAAVTIDCFQCHADRPEEAIRKEINPNRTVGLSDHDKIKHYLQLSNIEH